MGILQIKTINEDNCKRKFDKDLGSESARGRLLWMCCLG